MARTDGPAARSGSSAGRRIAAWVVGAMAVDGLTKLVAFLLAQVPIGGPIADVHNPGLSMSIVPNRFPLLVWLALTALVLFGGCAAALARRGSIPAWIPGLLIGGAGANLVDRMVFGAVHDWLRLGPVVLNLADVMILVAAIGILVRGSSVLSGPRSANGSIPDHCERPPALDPGPS